MVLALLCSSLLAQTTPPANAAAPAPTYPRVGLVVSRVVDVPMQDAMMITRRLADILKEEKVEVAESPDETVTRSQKLGLDSTKCEGKRACMAQLGTKLGFKFLLGVAVAQIGTDLAVSLDVVRTSDALSVFEQSFVVPSDDPNRLVRASRPLSQKLALVAPKYVPPAPALPAYAYFTGLQLGLRGDADLMDVPAFVGAATAEYSWRYIGVAGSALLSSKVRGGRLEGHFYPFNFELFRPYAALGASVLTSGVAPRAGLGTQLKVGNHFRLSVEGAAERFFASDTEIRPVAVLVGGGASWRF